MRIDLNCDMGESFGTYSIGEDQEIIKYITSANIACGFHAGDPQVMAKTVALAKRHGVAVGAHPGYPDLLGYGRRHLETLPGEIKNYLLYQIGALSAFTRSEALPLRHVKPHGALYHLAARDERMAGELIGAIQAYDPELILVILAGSLCAEMAAAAGLRVAHEAFPDRAYLATGQLAPRTMEGAVIQDPKVVSDRALQLVTTGGLTAIDGREVRLRAETLCLHGDTPGASKLAHAVCGTLAAQGVQLVRLGAD